MQKTALSGWTEEKERDEWGGEGKGRGGALLKSTVPQSITDHRA